MASASSTPATSPKCLFCKGEVAEDSDGSEPFKKLFGYHHQIPDKSTEELEKHLSMFFMLRKVLGLPTEILERLLVEYGNPTGWELHLCRQCSRLRAETESLWDRIRKFLKEFEKVVYEIKDVLVNSITTEEGEALVTNAEDLEAYKSVILKQIGSHQAPVQDSVRATFFMSLHQQANENEDPDNDFKSILNNAGNGKGAQIRNKSANQVKWTEAGVPFVTLNDFQKKMNGLLELIESSSKAITEFNDSQNTKKRKHIVHEDDTDKSSVVIEESEKIVENTGRSVRSTRASSRNPNVGTPTEIKTKLRGPKSAKLAAEKEPNLKIVQTSSLSGKTTDNSNESVPRVIGILKRDIQEDEAATAMDMDDDDEPFIPVDNDNDPDYCPDEEDTVEEPLTARSVAAPASKKKDMSDKEKNPENYPSNLKSLKIHAVKMNDKSFHCSECRLEFDTRQGCQIHILKDHYGHSKSYHCHICNCKFDQMYQMKEHIVKSHGIVRNPYDNDFDPEKDFLPFKRAGEHGEEEESIDISQLKNKLLLMYDCPVAGCDKKFDYKSKLNTHAMTAHGVNLKGQYHTNNSNNIDDGKTCEICADTPTPFKGITKDHLSVHKRIRHGIITESSTTSSVSSSTNSNNNPPKPAENVKPSKKVATKRTGGKPPSAAVAKKPTGNNMKCPDSDCSKVFSTQDELAEHLKKPEFQCSECTKHFQFDMDLKRHLELDHSDRRAFQCPYCPKTFTAQTIYQKHIENHQRFDVHECEVCKEKLTGFTNFTSHMETHSAFLQQQMRQDPEIFGI